MAEEDTILPLHSLLEREAKVSEADEPEALAVGLCVTIVPIDVTSETEREGTFSLSEAYDAKRVFEVWDVADGDSDKGRHDCFSTVTLALPSKSIAGHRGRTATALMMVPPRSGSTQPAQCSSLHSRTTVWLHTAPLIFVRGDEEEEEEEAAGSGAHHTVLLFDNTPPSVMVDVLKTRRNDASTL